MNHGDMKAANAGKEHYGGGHNKCDIEISPDGTNHWLPTIKDEHTRYVGQRFETVDQRIEFYRTYATTIGLDVRNNTMRKTREGGSGY
nr:protein FAR1-RELATED SEQUENCE 5-like [Ipomoea trifida]